MKCFPISGVSSLFLYMWVSLLLGSPEMQAQHIVHHLDTDDGLPGLHVYGTITDRLGYLWLATPKGVVKYNGYNCTVIGIGEGLPTDDNWRMLEDKAGRIWLNNISYEVGYLRNDRYHCGARFDNPVYPSAMVRQGSGIALLSKAYYLSNTNRSCEYIVCDGKQTRSTRMAMAPADRMRLNGSGDLIVHDWRGFLAYRKVDGQGKPGTASTPIPWHDKQAGHAVLFRHFLCTFGWYKNSFDVAMVTAKNCPTRRYLLPAADEEMIYAYELDDHCYFISDRRVYVYDSLFRLSASYSLAELTGGAKVCDRQYCIYSPSVLWGDLLCTVDKGLYRRTRYALTFTHKTFTGLQNCRFVGSVDSLGYWWDNERQVLCMVSRDTITRRYSLPIIRELQHIETLSGDTVLLSAADSNFLFRRSSLLPASCLNPGDSLSVKACVVTPGKTVFLLYGGSVPSLVKASCAGSRDIGPVPAKLISYDNHRHGLWLYHNLGLAFYDIKTGILQEIPHAVLLKMGIRKVESVVADAVYGNVFIKDLDKIWLLGDDWSSVQPVLARYRHHDAQLLVNGGRLIVGGRVGLLSLPLKGKGQFGTPGIYENTKDYYYNTLSDLQVCGQHALLKTDRGFYELDMKQQGVLDDTAQVVALLGDTTRNLKDGDTLILPPGTTEMHLDLVRPAGRGQPAFSYAWSKGATLVNALNNVVNLEKLKPYRSYRLYLQARDDVWNGKVLAIQVWKLPQWWQSYYFIAAMILLRLLLCVVIVLLTRKVVLKKQLEKQLMLELSLDATYAKINPHFIFNSLSIAQHHIKANRAGDAAQYINRFSRLLRSYLKSSRLRYISIGEELIHLEDYIVLQQERFENKFSYEISVENKVDHSFEVPTLLLQPFVENAIRHGLWHKEGKGHLSISFKALPKGLCISIEDNGVGREQARELNRTHSESYGNELMEKLVYLFNTYEKIKLRIDYADKEPSGTIVTITIQYLKQ